MVTVTNKKEFFFKIETSTVGLFILSNDDD
jgi:hypothetical protein